MAKHSWIYRLVIERQSVPVVMRFIEKEILSTVLMNKSSIQDSFTAFLHTIYPILIKYL